MVWLTLVLLEAYGFEPLTLDAVLGGGRVLLVGGGVVRFVDRFTISFP